MAWTSPRTWVAGETVTAALLNSHLRDNFKAIGDAWTAYTPTLGNITLGNGTLSAAYLQAGKWVVGRVRFVAGSTTTYTAGNLSWTLPVAYGSADSSTDAFGHGNVNNNSSASRQVCAAMPSAATGSTVLMVYNGAIVTNSAPFAWGTVSRFGFSFAYEAA